MNDNSEVVSMYECDKAIFSGIQNYDVAVMLASMGILVFDVTAEGLNYLRIHDNYSHLGLSMMGYAQRMNNGVLVNIPILHFTPKGVEALREVFKLVLGMADKTKVKLLVERSCSSKEDSVSPCDLSEDHQDFALSFMTSKKEVECKKKGCCRKMDSRCERVV